MVWRCIDRKYYDALAKMRELEIMHEVKEISRRTEKIDDFSSISS
jgi:hypothetical protein